VQEVALGQVAVVDLQELPDMADHSVQADDPLGDLLRLADVERRIRCGLLVEPVPTRRGEAEAPRVLWRLLNL